MVFCGVSHSWWCSNKSMLVFPPSESLFSSCYLASEDIPDIGENFEEVSKQWRQWTWGFGEPGDSRWTTNWCGSHGIMAPSWFSGSGIQDVAWYSTRGWQQGHEFQQIFCVKLNQTDSEVEYIASSAWFKVEIYSVLDWDTTNKIMTKMYNGDKANTNQ